LKKILIIVALLAVGYFVIKPSKEFTCVDTNGEPVASKMACHEADLLTPEQYAADSAQAPGAETLPSRRGPQQPSNPQGEAAIVEASSLAPLDSAQERIAVLTAVATRLQCRVPDVSARLAPHVSQMLSLGSEPVAIAPDGARPGSSIEAAACGDISVRNSIRSAVARFYQGPSDELPAVFLDPIR
jgi:hypothetical protein